MNRKGFLKVINELGTKYPDKKLIKISLLEGRFVYLLNGKEQAEFVAKAGCCPTLLATTCDTDTVEDCLIVSGKYKWRQIYTFCKVIPYNQITQISFENRNDLSEFVIM